MLQKKHTTASVDTERSGSRQRRVVGTKSLMCRKNLLTIGTLLFFGVLIWACKSKDEGYDEYYYSLPAPANLKAEQVDDVINVSWDTVPAASSYMLYVLTKDGTEVASYKTQECKKVFTPKEEGIYYFQVQSVTTYETSSRSNTVYCSYTDPNVLRVPTGLTARQVKDSIKVSWNPVGAADSYILYLYNSRTGRSENFDCKEPHVSFYNLTNGATYRFQVKACRGDESTDWSNAVSCVYSAPVGGSISGMYLGIIGFNEELNEMNISMLTDYKNTYNTSEFTSFVNNMKMTSGTSLYYAVDNAINRLESSVLPEDLVNVSIVTFTDGLDNVSIDKNTKYSSRDAYRDAVKQRITNTKIKGLNINAYSIGLKGRDIDNAYLDEFRASLKYLVRDTTNAIEVKDMDGVNKEFVRIANSLYNENKSQTVKLKITGGYDDGTKIRFTFDNVADAAQSKFYIEGTYKRNGTTRTLQDIVYHGVKSSGGTTVKGSVSGVYVTFSFENFMLETTTAMNYNIKQWEYIASTSRWQVNSEFDPTGSTETVVETKSAVVILVLDCTTSLDTNFPLMKNAANNFIKVFTNK